LPPINKLQLPAVIALACVAVAAILLATKPGIGITPDSTVYLEAGRNLAGGHGLIALSANGELKPLTHYPPLYPAAIAVISAAGLSAETAARWLNAFLFGASILLVGFALARLASKSFWTPVLGSFLALTAVDIVGIHTLALSEPLFMFLAFAGFILLAAYFDDGEQRLLFAAALAIAAAFLTRYVGVVLVFTGVVAIVLFHATAYRRRVVDAAIFVTIACTPMLLWTIRNHYVGGETTDRSLAFHPIKLGQIAAGFSTMSSWLLLGKVRTDLRAAGFLIQILVIAAMVAYWFIRMVRKPNHALPDGRDAGLVKLPAILATFIISNFLFLIFAASFIESATYLDDRSLVAMHFAAVILGTILAWRLYRSATTPPKLRLALVILALLLAVSYSFRAVNWFAITRGDAQGYAGRSWTESDTIARIRSLPADAAIYSNGHDAIYYLTGRRAIYLPQKVNMITGRANENYEAQLKQIAADLQAGGGVLVYFNTLSERWFLPTAEELESKLAWNKREAFADGTIYRR